MTLAHTQKRCTNTNLVPYLLKKVRSDAASFFFLQTYMQYIPYGAMLIQTMHYDAVFYNMQHTYFHFSVMKSLKHAHIHENVHKLSRPHHPNSIHKHTHTFTNYGTHHSLYYITDHKNV